MLAGRMADALAHRGPDGRGVACFRHAALAHNRLAIIDLETGQQPVHGASGATCLVFNGEIYNHRELRESLVGYPFRTRSDSEVIVALYETEGASAWQRLRGMYAFALWDERTQQGFLVRDPVGIKPLFYAHHEDKLLFASEAKGILAHGLRAKLDTDALHQLLNFRYITGDASLFQGVRQLPPGTMFTWRQGVARQFPCLPDTGYGEGMGESLDSLLEQSVQSHLLSDVPVGCFLSGGVDSALIARIAAKHTPLTSYTLEVGDDPGEADNARQTARWLDIPNLRQPFRMENTLALHQQMLWHLETPKTNALQGMVLAKCAASHVKVALSGLGGDELFYGYNAHRIMLLGQQLSSMLPAPVARGVSRLLAPLTGGQPWNERQRAVEMLGRLPDMDAVYGILRNVWDCAGHRVMLYGPRMLDAAPPDSFVWLHGQFPQGGDAARGAALFELSNKLVNDLLWNEDRTSMHAGLESRVPLLDWRLISYFQHHARHELMPWGRKKHALKHSARHLLPTQLLRRRKSGFQMDIVHLAQNELKPIFDEYLAPERVRHHQLFNPDFVSLMRKAPTSKGLRWHYFLLYLMAQTHMLIEAFDVD